MDPRWLSLTIVLAIHSDQVREHGGSPGIRDKHLLESALDRALNRFHYEPGSDLARLAAAYGYGIATNHPFIDGNKRAALGAAPRRRRPPHLGLGAGRPRLKTLLQ